MIVITSNKKDIMYYYYGLIYIDAGHEYVCLVCVSMSQQQIVLNDL